MLGMSSIMILTFCNNLSLSFVFFMFIITDKARSKDGGRQKVSVL